MKTHSIITADTFESRDGEEWRSEPLALKPRAKTSDAFLESLFKPDRIIWPINRRTAEKVFAHVLHKSPLDFETETPKEHDDDSEAQGFITFKRKHGIAETVIESYERAYKWGFPSFAPSAIEQTIDRFQTTFEIACAFTPAMTGMYLLKNLHARTNAQAMLEPPSSVEPFEVWKDYALKWTRPLTSEEKGKRYVHSFDKNHSYMGASAIELGVNEWRHFDKPRFSKETPGIWRCAIKNRGRINPLLPDPLKAREGVEWYYTPTLTLLIEQGAQVEIQEAYLFAEKRKVFGGWYTRVLDAKREAQADGSEVGRCFLRMLKSMYTQTFGFLGSQWTKGWMHRPDWRNAIISNANQRMYRNAEKVWLTSGHLAAACYDDALYYVSDSPDPRELSPFFTDKNLMDAYKFKDSYLIESETARDLFNQTPQIFARDIKLFSLANDERAKAQESAREQSAIDSERAARLAESIRLLGEEGREAA